MEVANYIYASWHYFCMPFPQVLFLVSCLVLHMSICHAFFRLQVATPYYDTLYTFLFSGKHGSFHFVVDDINCLVTSASLSASVVCVFIYSNMFFVLIVAQWLVVTSKMMTMTSCRYRHGIVRPVIQKTATRSLSPLCFYCDTEFTFIRQN